MMKPVALHKLISLLLFWNILCCCSQPKDQYAVEPVATPGFYKIYLAPHHKAHARYDLGNLRLLESSSKEIPYIIETESHKNIPLRDFRFTVRNVAAEKTSFIQIDLDYPARIDAIAFDIKGPALYKRQARIFYSVLEPAFTHKRYKPGQEEVQNLLLYSEDPDTFFLEGGIYVKSIRIEISNEDNAALDIDSVHLFQQAEYLICSLIPGKTYYLEWLDKTTEAPNYDLKYFRGKIGENLPVATLAKTGTAVLPVTASRDTEKICTEPSRWFLWTCIGIGGLVVLALALTLLKDMKKQ